MKTGLIEHLREAISALALRRRIRTERPSTLPHIVRIGADEAYSRDFNRLWREIKKRSADGSFDANFKA